MNLPPIDKNLLAKMGITPNPGGMPIPSVELGINYGIQSQPREPKIPKAITPQEARDLFGVSQSVKMNFIPQMLVALALDSMTKFVNHCRDNRIQEFKKQNRFIATCIEEYTWSLKNSYGKAFRAYTEYVSRYFDYVEIDRFKMWCSISNIVNRQLSADIDREAAVQIAIAHNLFYYAEKYDRKMDKLIADKLKYPVSRRQDGILRLIIAMCIEFEETWGLRIEPDPMIELNMGVLANRAATLADAIIGEENVSKC